MFSVLQITLFLTVYATVHDYLEQFYLLTDTLDLNGKA